MQEQLVSFNTAVLAKEKGFNWKCRGYYSSLYKTVMINGTLHGAVDRNSTYYDKFAGAPYYSAPTQSILQKWLREKHSLHITVSFSKSGGSYEPIGYFDYHAYKNDGVTIYVEDGFGFDTYESALEHVLFTSLKQI